MKQYKDNMEDKTALNMFVHLEHKDRQIFLAVLREVDAICKTKGDISPDDSAALIEKYRLRRDIGVTGIKLVEIEGVKSYA